MVQRFAQSLKQQNWTTISIEFVLLVLGVFLGIQAANWNEERLDAARAQAYLARIQDNLRTDLAAIDRRAVFWTQVSTYGMQAVHYAETGQLVDGSAWNTVLAFYQASQVWLYASDDTTYQELKSSGELGLIQDEAVRIALATYYREGKSVDVEYILGMIPEYRRIVRGLSPAVVTRQIWSQCHRQADYGEQFLMACASPMSEADAQALLDVYVAHPKLLEELRFWMSNQTVASKMIAANRDAAIQVLKQLGAGAAP